MEQRYICVFIYKAVVDRTEETSDFFSYSAIIFYFASNSFFARYREAAYYLYFL